MGRFIFLKNIRQMFFIAIAFAMTDILSLDASSTSFSNDAGDVSGAKELEQSLVLIKRIEKDKQELPEGIIEKQQISTAVEQTQEEQTQEKLIAEMAERMNDSYGLSNQDNSIIIGGVALNHQDKLILKNFVEGIREQLTKITGIKFSPAAYRIMIYGVVPKTANESENKSKYKINIVPDAMPYQDAATIRITISHPAAMDSYEFAENVIRGYFALYTYVLRDSNYNGKSFEPPRWFFKGLAKQIDFTSRQKDINDVIHMWSNGYVPSLEKLTSATAIQTQSNMALSSTIVGFWIDCGKAKESIATLFKKLANGEEWSSKLFRESAKPNSSVDSFDYGFDYWLLTQRFKVFEVGSSTDDLAKRIITNLMLVPGAGIVPETAGVKWVAISPAELAKFKGEPWAKKFAERKQRFLLVTSAGRNDEFRAAVSDLIAFYQAIIDGKASEEELRMIYTAAETKLFAAVSKGEN